MGLCFGHFDLAGFASPWGVVNLGSRFWAKTLSVQKLDTAFFGVIRLAEWGGINEPLMPRVFTLPGASGWLEGGFRVASGCLAVGYQMA